jgi:aspartyl-tRNA(Asn)/glutamyl-tRNA(Gln) amidotransferase subunit A
MCLGALGTDTGGSIRGPAAWCGIAGFKPTYGLVSRHGVAPLSFSQDHVGPMCWTVEDCALMLQVLAARDPRDPASAQGPVVDYSAAIQGDLKGVRIGVVRHFFEQDSEADAPAVGAFENALQVFRDSGCSIQNVTLAPLLTYYDASGLIERAEAFSVHQSTLSDRPDLYGALGRQRIGSGAFIAATDYLNALRWRRSLIEQALDVMGQVDVLLMPTRGNAAMKLGSYDLLTGRQIYTRPFNLLGFPALSVCSGFTDDGLPLAMQVVARPFEDALALKVGHFFERQTGLRARRPPLGTLLNEER